MSGANLGARGPGSRTGSGASHAGPRYRAAILQLLLASSLILSAAIVDPILSTRPGPARAATTDQQRGTEVMPDQPSPRAKRKQERRQARHQDRKQDRKRDRRQSNQKRDRKRHDARNGRDKDNLDIGHLCDTEASSPRGGPCTHGPDPAPPGFAIKQDVAPLPFGTAAAQAATIVCDGDGQSGFRVHLLYVHADDVPSRYALFRSSIQAWAAEADQIFRHSAAKTGGERSIRFVHDGQCLPEVTEVAVSPAGDGNFWTTVDELKARGFARTDRIYQAFVDANAYCGVGMMWSDDRGDSAANRHNTGPGFSRIDSGCWSGGIAAHELMHTLGGVQLSAPNSSGGFHCIDEYDVMCYADGSLNLGVRVDCGDPADDWLILDCNHDDYFSTNPAPGSYLATHWNAANNRFLIGAPAMPASIPPAATSVPADTQRDNGGKHKRGQGSAKNKKKSKKSGGASRNRSHAREVVRA